MRIIITGATSFIGTALVERLCRQGHEVYAVVRPNSLNAHKLKAFKVSVISLDMHCIENLLQMERLYGSDVWLQFAWDGIGSQGRSDVGIQNDNLLICKRAFAVASALGCKRFFFSGSQAEYGLCSELTSECHNCLPISEYGKAKLAFGNWAAECSRYLTMKYYHLRIFSVYGPGDHEYSLVNTCVDRFASGEVMEFGECTQKWNYMFIDDCVEAITSLMVSESDGGIYNIASNDTRQLKDYISEINRIYGGNGTAVYGVKPPNAEGVTSLIPDISKLMNAANWYPKTSFCDGIVKIRRP